MKRLHEEKIDLPEFYEIAWPKEVASNPDGLFDTERMLALVRNVQPGDKVLDVGAGVFGAAQFIAQHRPDLKSCELHAFDQSYTARDIVAEIAPEIRWRLGEITDGLPFDDQEFDVVISGETIEHMLDPQSFAVELMRVGKSVAVSTTNHECEQAKLLDYPEHVWAIDESDLRRFFPGCEYELVGNIHIACWPASEIDGGDL